jgi:hypothetical protein
MKKITALFALLFVALTISASADKVEDILNKNIKAHGGEKAMKEIKSTYIEMDMGVMGMNVPMKTWMKSPDKSRTEVNAMGQNTITVKNGNKEWMKQGTQVKELTPDEIGQMEFQEKMNSPVASNMFLDYKKNGYSIAYNGSETVDGKDCEKITMINKDSSITMYWYFDKNTGLESKYIIKLPDAPEENQGQAPSQIEITIKEFMTVDGIVIAKVFETNLGMYVASMTIKKIELNKPIEDSLFAQPK